MNRCAHANYDMLMRWGGCQRGNGTVLTYRRVSDLWLDHEISEIVRKGLWKLFLTEKWDLIMETLFMVKWNFYYEVKIWWCSMKFYIYMLPINHLFSYISYFLGTCYTHWALAHPFLSICIFFQKQVVGDSKLKDDKYTGNRRGSRLASNSVLLR